MKDMSREQFSKKAAFYLGEINMLHPFREGNGRTQREFLLELSREAGWELDLSKVSRDEMIHASQQSANSTKESLSMTNTKKASTAVSLLKLNN